jgi:hypothetical protein
LPFSSNSREAGSIVFGKGNPAFSRVREVKCAQRLGFLVILTILFFPAIPVAAQADLPATPPAEMCVVAPLDASYLLILANGEFEPAGNHEATSEPVSDSDLAAITSAIEQSIACTNANRPLAALALFTDRYLAETFSSERGSDELGHMIAASSREAAPASPQDRLVLIAISNAEQYQDGRIAVQVTTENADYQFQDILIFQNTGGEWLIDEVLAGDEVIPVGTPNASSQLSPKTVG